MPADDLATMVPGHLQRECVSIHIGQPGVRLGDTTWQLYCHEHGIKPDGYRSDGLLADTKPDIFFNWTSNGKFTPRCLYVDLEPNAIEEVRSGPYGKLYHPRQFINGKKGTSSMYPRGYSTIGKKYIDSVMEQVRNQLEKCEGFHGFLFFHSPCGGTGSGFTSLLMEKLSEEHGKKPVKFEIAVHPSPRISHVTVEPYNTVLATHATLEHSNCAVLFQNESIYDICKKSLEVEQPSFSNSNQVISQVVSSITASLRFKEERIVDLGQITRELVALPRLHFTVSSYAPLMTAEEAKHFPPDVAEMTKACFDPLNQMFKCDPPTGRYMAWLALCRGDIAPGGVGDAISKMKEKILYPDSFNLPKGPYFCPFPPTEIPSEELPKLDRALCVLSNTTAIAKSWASLRHKFDFMYAKRVHIERYTKEGMEEEDFKEARENLLRMEKEYEKIESGE